MVTAACPVAALAAEARAVTAALDRNEEEQTRVGRGSLANVRLEHERWLLEDRRTAIETGACQLRAHSPRGCCSSSRSPSSSPPCSTSTATPAGRSRARPSCATSTGRCTRPRPSWSAGGGPRREEVFGDWYLSRRLDPHATIEAALAAG
jgi:hypothetical protein